MTHCEDSPLQEIITFVGPKQFSIFRTHLLYIFNWFLLVYMFKFCIQNHSKFSIHFFELIKLAWHLEYYKAFVLVQIHNYMNEIMNKVVLE